MATNVLSTRRSKSLCGVVLAMALLVGVTGCSRPLIGAVGGLPSGSEGSDSDPVQDGTPEVPRHCEAPAPGAAFEVAEPEEVRLDRAGLEAAVDYASKRGAQSVRVYRHGCLIARSANDPSTERVPMSGWSMTKGVVATVVGRAVALGRLGVDDPIGKYIEGLDQAHAAITVRQLLNQTSGLRFAWLNDLWAAAYADSVAVTLERPFEATPGTEFRYAQTTITVLVAVVEAAVGEEFQSFTTRELFEPIGIQGDWRWARDGSGRTQGFFALEMSPIGWAKLGQLLVDEGSWRGRSLIDPDYIAQGSKGSAANPGYGFCWPTNSGDWHLNSGFPGTQRKERRIWPTLPRDAFGYAGLFDQAVTVVPSLDIVVVRMGLPADVFGDPLGESKGIRPKWEWRFNRLLMQSVTDVDVPDPGDWRFEGPEPPVDWKHIIEPSLPPFPTGPRPS
jgi:CubicO group peptidase (beta-lactamase class C family)